MGFIFTILKYVFYICNLVILLFGVVLLFVGVYTKINTPVIPDPILSLLNPGNIIILFSVLIIVFSLIGTLGSVRENTWLLGIYAGSILLLILIEVALILFVYLGKEKVYEIANNAILKLIEAYRSFSDLRVVVDYVQSSLNCCGSQSIDDWDENIYFNCNFTGISACGVPTSCCRKEFRINSQCGYLARNISSRLIYINDIGCIQGFENLITDNLNILAGCLPVLFVLEIVVISFSLWLIVGVKRKRDQVSFSHETDNTNRNTSEDDWDLETV